MYKSTLFVLFVLLSTLLIGICKADDFDPTKYARFDVYCKSECGKSESRTITLSVGRCESFGDHCGDKPSIQVMTYYNETTNEYTFTGSAASDATCSVVVQEAQTVSMYECFTLLDYFNGHHELTGSSTKLSISVILISFTVLLSLFI